MADTMSTSRIVATAAAASLLCAAAAHAQGSSSNAPARNRQTADLVQRIDDRASIERLLVEYGRTLDARDFKGYSELFAKDGVWSGGMGTVQGPAAIQAFMEKAIPGPNTAHNFHILSNFAIDVNGDTATAWSRWTFMVPGPNNTAVAAQSGRYDDTLVREDGRWKFKRRVASNDIPAAGPAPKP
jgi:uncharacterized protein (TIGR02246 family)